MPLGNVFLVASIAAIPTALGGGHRPRARWWRLVEQIGQLEQQLQPLDDGALRKRSLSLRFRAKSGEPLAKLLPEAFALVREAAVRTIADAAFRRPDDGWDRPVSRPHRRDGHG